MSETTTTDQTQRFKAINEDRLTRVALIDRKTGKGLVYESFPARIELDVQDDGQTLKVFVHKLPKRKATEARRKRREGWERFFALLKTMDFDRE